MASAVVTRCAGFIGSHLTEALLEDADVVYHLAGEPGVRASWGPRFDRYTHHNVQATQRLLEAATEHAHLRFVYSSSSSIYGDALTLPTHEDETPRPLSPYGVTKLAAEHLCVLLEDGLAAELEWVQKRTHPVPQMHSLTAS
jgi:nucleoside-diphosphate-sugar epimerase